jgi:hypothetical protein
MSKLSTRPPFVGTEIQDTDLFMIAIDNGDTTFTSQKIDGADLKNLVVATEFADDSTFLDAGSDKSNTVSRNGSIKVRENNTTLSKFTQLLSYGLTILSDTYAQIYQTTVSATVYPLTRMTRKRGTITSQTNAETGDTLGMIAWSGGSNDSALIFAQATENHTGNVGTTLYFQTAQTGSSGLNTVMWVDGNGRANFPIGINPQVQSVTSSATVTPTSLNDLVKITAQATGLTLANPTGTFTEGQALMIRIKDNGTARAITFDTNYRAIGITLPTTTVISKTMYLGIIYNSTDAKFDIIGYNIQA